MQCRYITRKGKQCSKPAIMFGLCNQHYSFAVDNWVSKVKQRDWWLK